MAYDEKLAERVRDILRESAGVAERKMFGGLAFLVRGHMCCGIVGSDLMVRVGAGETERALSRPHARPMDFTGRPMNGMVYVAPEGFPTKKALRSWVERGVAFVETLPEKTAAGIGRAPNRKRKSRFMGSR